MTKNPIEHRSYLEQNNNNTRNRDEISDVLILESDGKILFSWSSFYRFQCFACLLFRLSLIRLNAWAPPLKYSILYVYSFFDFHHRYTFYNHLSWICHPVYHFGRIFKQKTAYFIFLISSSQELVGIYFVALLFPSWYNLFLGNEENVDEEMKTILRKLKHAQNSNCLVISDIFICQKKKRDKIQIKMNKKRDTKQKNKRWNTIWIVVKYDWKEFE